MADFIGGMENVSATTLVDWLPDARAYRDRPWYRQSLIPHELAHQWFGDLVTAENWAQLLAQRGHGRVHAGAVLGREAGPPRGAGLLPRRVSAVPAQGRPPADAARHLELQQRVSQGRAGALDAAEAAGPRAVLGAIEPLSHQPRLRQRDQRRSPPGGARRHGAESALVLVAVDLPAGYPEFAVASRYDTAASRADPHRAPDPGDTATADSSGVRFSVPRRSARRSRSGSGRPRETWSRG